jgi:hypothetical protein
MRKKKIKTKHVQLNEAITLLVGKVTYLESVVDDIGDKNLPHVDMGDPMGGEPSITPDQSLREVIGEAASLIRDLAGRIEIAAAEIQRNLF